MPDDEEMRLPRLRGERATDEQEEWLATAAGFADQLTMSGSRCDLDDGSTRFCHWQALELAATDADGRHLVGVRCTVHPGGRHTDASARLAPEDFAPTRDEPDSQP